MTRPSDVEYDVVLDCMLEDDAPKDSLLVVSCKLFKQTFISIKYCLNDLCSFLPKTKPTMSETIAITEKTIKNNPQIAFNNTAI